MALYLYSGENWNDEHSKWGDIALLDGQFIVNKGEELVLEVVGRCKNELTRQQIENYIAVMLFNKLRREAVGGLPLTVYFVI